MKDDSLLAGEADDFDDAGDSYDGEPLETCRCDAQTCDSESGFLCPRWFRRGDLEG